MIQEGLLEIPGHDPDQVSFALLARDLRGLGIGFGRERYRAVLDEQIASLKLRIGGDGEERDDEGETRPGSSGRLQFRLKSFELLCRLIDALLDHAPTPDDGAPRVLELARRFVEEHAHCASQLDHYAREILVAQIDDMLEAMEGLRTTPGRARLPPSRVCRSSVWEVPPHLPDGILSPKFPQGQAPRRSR